MSHPFKMRVKNLFIVDKKVIFTGELEASSQQISAVDCKVLVDGIETAQLRIDGEVMGTRHRDLWTTAPIDITRELVYSHDVWLVSAG